MSQLDWVGGTSKPAKSFRDIRNQKPSVAERKATLCHELKGLALKAASCVINGSVQRVREWREAQAKAMKVAGSSRSSVVELELAVKSLETFA